MDRALIYQWKYSLYGKWDRPTSPALLIDSSHLRLFLTLQVSSVKTESSSSSTWFVFPDHKLLAVALPCTRSHHSWSSLQSTGMCHWFYSDIWRRFFHVRSDSAPQIESWIASKQLKFNQRRSRVGKREIRICVYRPIDYVKSVSRRRMAGKSNWELNFTEIQMKKKASQQQKFLYRWKRKVYATLLFAFCLGSFVLIQARFNGIAASLNSLKPRLDQKPQIAFLFIARNRIPLEFVWDAFFQVYKQHCLDSRIWGSDVKFIAAEN